MYERNIFTFVGCQLPIHSLALGHFGRAPLIPLSAKPAKRMRHHSLHVHMNLNAGSIEQSAAASERTGKKHWCLLLIQDLNAFCQVLRASMANIDGAG